MGPIGLRLRLVRSLVLRLGGAFRCRGRRILLFLFFANAVLILVTDRVLFYFLVRVVTVEKGTCHANWIPFGWFLFIGRIFIVLGLGQRQSLPVWAAFQGYGLALLAWLDSEQGLAWLWGFYKIWISVPKGVITWNIILGTCIILIRCIFFQFFHWKRREQGRDLVADDPP